MFVGGVDSQDPLLQELLPFVSRELLGRFFSENLAHLVVLSDLFPFSQYFDLLYFLEVGQYVLDVLVLNLQPFSMELSLDLLMPLKGQFFLIIGLLVRHGLPS